MEMLPQNTGNGNYSQNRGIGCIRKLIVAIGLLIILCLCSLPMFSYFYLSIIPSTVSASQLENVPQAMELTNKYTKYGVGYPLPSDVELSEEIMDFAKSKGFSDPFQQYDSIKACISAADVNGIGRKELCSLLDTVDTAWRAETRAESFISAYGTARWLLDKGYKGEEQIKFDVLDDGEVSCKNKSCEAIFEFYNHDSELFLQYPPNIEVWELVETANTWDRNEEGILPYASHFEEFWNYSNLNYGDIVDFDGIPGIPTDPYNPPPGLPPIADGNFVHPVPGGCISGYRFNPAHRGTDYSCSPDGWARAAHNATVIFSGWNNQGYGYMTFIRGVLKNGTLVCSLYAHGESVVRTAGDKLKAGDGIFLIGSTGNSSGPHLHFEIRTGGSGEWCYGGTYLNPEVVLPPQ